ncbi:MAG: arginase family protein [Candidatus Krumholzibacteria bacterium]|nr:arginase family protein [Candidatus Krumholzibacteria bacterium]
MDYSHDFLGTEASGTKREVLVLSVPVELTTSYLSGTAGAPEAIIEASRQIELFNPAAGIDLEGAGIATVRTGARDRGALAGFIRENRAELSEVFCCFLGGEHAITPWILEEMAYGPVGIVWLDAHADLREQYLGDPHSHACAARNSMPFGPIVQIGVRSWSRGEQEFMRTARGVTTIGRWGGGARAALDTLPPRVYLSLDYAAFDPSVIRAVGTPEPGRLSWDDIVGILDHLFATREVVGMDAVELCPSAQDAASDFIAAKAVYEAISRHLARKGTV